MLDSNNGYIVSRDKDKLINMRAPASRELALGDEKVLKNLISTH